MLLIVTADPSMALKAVELPRYMQPSAAFAAVTSSCALNGIPNRELTRPHVEENGMAPSRAKAQSTREVESWDEMTHGPSAMKRMKVSPKAPPADCVAWRKSSASGRPVFVVASAL